MQMQREGAKEKKRTTGYQLTNPPMIKEKAVVGPVTGYLVVVATSLLAWIWGQCSTTHSLPALFVVVVVFEVEVSSRTLIPLVMPGSVHCGSANRDNCGRVFPDELRVTSFPDRLPHYSCTVA